MIVTFNQIFYLIIFIVIAIIIVNQNQKDMFVNICQSYNHNGIHCPYRVKYRDGTPTINKPLIMNQNCDCQKDKKILSLYNSDLLLTNNLTKNCTEVNQENSKHKPLNFIKFADKYPVAIKIKNTNLCGK
jgi:hypothetical protein